MLSAYSRINAQDMDFLGAFLSLSFIEKVRCLALSVLHTDGF